MNKEILEEQGYQVIPRVLSNAEVQIARNKFWEWLRLVDNQIDPHSMRTWSDSWWPGDARGFLSAQGISQSDFVWYLRGHPNVVRLFSDFWKTSDLICSLDSVICWRPWWRFGHDSWKPRVEGHHVDQHPINKPGFHCLQAMIPLYDVTPEVGGLSVVPGSHMFQQYLADRYYRDSDPEDKTDWCVLSSRDFLLSDVKLIEARAGDLIVWDSRLVHGGLIGTGGVDRPEDPIELARLAVPISMIPRNKASKEVQNKRKMAFQKQQTLNHWASEFNLVYDGSYQQKVVNYRLTQEQERLL